MAKTRLSYSWMFLLCCGVAMISQRPLQAQVEGPPTQKPTVKQLLPPTGPPTVPSGQETKVGQANGSQEPLRPPTVPVQVQDGDQDMPEVREFQHASINASRTLGGIALPPGCKIQYLPSMCSVEGQVVGPNDFKLRFSIWSPEPEEGAPRHSGHFVAEVRKREHTRSIINGELAEIALNEASVSVDFPSRGLHLVLAAATKQQLMASMLIVASISNVSRPLPWSEVEHLDSKEVKWDVQQIGELEVLISQGESLPFRTSAPNQAEMRRVLDRLVE